ncbi:helix-turn-helix domain-containing protein [soil metagenome]
MGRTANYSQERCSVAATLEVVGDPWTMLILRDAFNGTRRFEQWQSKLGVARNVLAARLKSLTQHGVLVKQAYTDRPPRYEYLLTQKGRDLFPLMTVMLNWGDTHVYGEGSEPRTYTHTACGGQLKTMVVCECCGAKPHPNDIRAANAAGALTVGQAMSRIEANDRRPQVEICASSAMDTSVTAAAVVAMNPPPRTRSRSAAS